MIRMLVSATVCLVVLLPASAQQSVRVAEHPASAHPTLHAQEHGAAAHPSVRIQEHRAHVEIELHRPGLPVPAGEPASFSRRAGALAGAIVRALASQNPVPFAAHEDEMDAFLRPPSSESDGLIFRRAEKIYNEATTIRTDRYALSVNPLELKCLVRVRLGVPGD